MNYVFTGARLLLGLLMLIGGVNGFYQFMEVPDLHPFMKILVESDYLYVVKALEVAAAFMLLSNKKIPLALVLITPVVVNIALFHLFLDPRNPVGGILAVVFTGILLWQHRERFMPIVRAE
ncbi:MAG: membrane spanning transport protein [Calditrichia bacterium]